MLEHFCCKSTNGRSFAFSLLRARTPTYTVAKFGTDMVRHNFPDMVRHNFPDMVRHNFPMQGNASKIQCIACTFNLFFSYLERSYTNSVKFHVMQIPFP